MSESAMNRRYGELVREFPASLGVHVRDDGEGGVVDEREERAREMADRSAEELADLMGDVPQDLAAMISDAIARVREPSVNRIMFLQEGRLQAALQQMNRFDNLPLQAKDGHPVANLLDGLVETGAGCDLYRDMAVILLRASRDSDVRGLLRFRVERGKSVDERPAPHIDEEVEQGGTEDRDDADSGGDHAEAS